MLVYHVMFVSVSRLYARDNVVVCVLMFELTLDVVYFPRIRLTQLSCLAGSGGV